MSKRKGPVFKKTSVIIDSEVDFEFRKLASKKFQFQKGWYSNAIAEAMTLWLKANERVYLDRGITPMVRFMGDRMWDYFNYNLSSKYEGSKIDVMYDIFEYFKNDEKIKNVKHNWRNEKLNCKVSIPQKLIDSEFEEHLESKIIPLSIITRAGIEDITGDDFKFSKIRIDNRKSRIDIKKEPE